MRIGVDVATPPADGAVDAEVWDSVLGSSPAGLIAVGVMAVAGLVAAMALMRTTLSPSPGFGVQYARRKASARFRTRYHPHRGGAQTQAYRDRLSSRRTRIADVGPDRAEEVGDPLDRDGAGQEGDGSGERGGGHSAGVRKPGREFRADGTVSAGATLERATAKMGEAVRQWALDAGLVVPKRSEWWARVANGVALALAIAALFRLFGGTVWIVPFGLFFVATMTAWRPGVGLRRTAAGRELWSRAGGFHRLVATDSAESRFDFAARKDLYTAYIPFAVAAGRQHCGRRSIRPRPAHLHRSPAGITPPVRTACSAGRVRDSTVSSRPCRRRSVPTRPRGRPVVAGAVAVVAGAGWWGSW